MVGTHGNTVLCALQEEAGGSLPAMKYLCTTESLGLRLFLTVIFLHKQRVNDISVTVVKHTGFRVG